MNQFQLPCLYNPCTADNLPLQWQLDSGNKVKIGLFLILIISSHWLAWTEYKGRIWE
jgi:hypothetical protein